MTGRGTGWPRGKCAPEDVKVTIGLRVTTSSPTLSLSSDQGPKTPFYVQVHASVKSSTRPDLPVTLATYKTPLDFRTVGEDHTADMGGEKVSVKKGERDRFYSPIWSNSGLTYFQSTRDPSRRFGPSILAVRFSRRWKFARNIRETWEFLTIPAMTPISNAADYDHDTDHEKQHHHECQTKREVMVEHYMPFENLSLFYTTDPSEKMKPEIGEKFIIRPHVRALGTYWWTWGDLDGDLAGKKFWSDEWSRNEDEDEDGEKNEEGEQDVEGDDWVKSEGEEGAGLEVEVDSCAEIEIV